MYPTKNDLPEATRSKVTKLLNARLAESIDLFLQAKQAHWTVKGLAFYALHELFDEVADAAREYVDEIAERITQLGGVAEGTVNAVSKRTHLPEYPLDIADGRDHVERLSVALATFGAAARKGIDEATEVRDADTADLLTEVSRGIDKLLWMVEAHAQTAR